MAKVAFLGLGVMGYPMAGHLASAGNDVTVYNRTISKAKAWAQEFKGSIATTAAEAAKNCDIVFSCVGNDDDLRQIALGEQGVLAGMSPHSIYVDHTTASAEVVKEIAAKAQALHVAFMDAPVSGGQAGAENGQLAIMCGGHDDAFNKAQSVMTAYAKSCELMGDVGSGQLTKMVNQICIAGLVQGLSEGVAFAINAGLDAKQVFKAIGGGAAGSWQLANRYNTMIDDQFDFGFAVDWMRKDLAICLQAAADNGSLLPVTELVDSYYAQVQEMGGRRWDTSSLVKRLPRKDTTT